MTFVVIYDANVLYPSTLRDVLIRLAQTGLVQARWTETILDETFRSLHANRPDLDETRLQRTRTLMNLAVRDAVVTGYEPLIGSLHLPDLDDRHRWGDRSRVPPPGWPPSTSRPGAPSSRLAREDSRVRPSARWPCAWRGRRPAPSASQSSESAALAP